MIQDSNVVSNNDFKTVYFSLSKSVALNDHKTTLYRLRMIFKQFNHLMKSVKSIKNSLINITLLC